MVTITNLPHPITTSELMPRNFITPAGYPYNTNY
jgi:hypothetical protein